MKHASRRLRPWLISDVSQMMKTLVLSLVLFSAGGVAGYFTRAALAENRTQRNLGKLSGEALTHLDEVARFTRGLSGDEIERRWKEHVAFTRVEADIGVLREAWQAWERAIIFQQVERVGWPSYRELIIHNSNRYLAFLDFDPGAAKSDFARRETKRAVDMIREAIPQELLEKYTSPY